MRGESCKVFCQCVAILRAPCHVRGLDCQECGETVSNRDLWPLALHVGNELIDKAQMRIVRKHARKCLQLLLGQRGGV